MQQAEETTVRQTEHGVTVSRPSPFRHTAVTEEALPTPRSGPPEYSRLVRFALFVSTITIIAAVLVVIGLVILFVTLSTIDPEF